MTKNAQQVLCLHPEFDTLQKEYGDSTLASIYGAGNISHPKIMFIFMNPTGGNVSAQPNWSGLRAPWLGTKQIWSLFNDLHLLDNQTYKKITESKPIDWDVAFADNVYQDITEHSTYVTNLAKCTQTDARPLNNKVFRKYLDLMYREIEIVKPQKIVTFGNQVSSILLDKTVSVSNYLNDEKEQIEISTTYDVYPTFYPVGQGRRNMGKAVERIRQIIS
jgi:DNA polymerase